MPAYLQYWNDFLGDYGEFVTYATFALSESADVTVTLPDPPNHRNGDATAQQRQDLIYRVTGGDPDVYWGGGGVTARGSLPIAASSWRILVNCVCRNGLVHFMRHGKLFDLVTSITDYLLILGMFTTGDHQ